MFRAQQGGTPRKICRRYGRRQSMGDLPLKTKATTTKATITTATSETIATPKIKNTSRKSAQDPQLLACYHQLDSYADKSNEDTHRKIPTSATPLRARALGREFVNNDSAYESVENRAAASPHAKVSLLSSLREGMSTNREKGTKKKKSDLRSNIDSKDADELAASTASAESSISNLFANEIRCINATEQTALSLHHSTKLPEKETPLYFLQAGKSSHDNQNQTHETGVHESLIRQTASVTGRENDCGGHQSRVTRDYQSTTSNIDNKNIYHDCKLKLSKSRNANGLCIEQGGIKKLSSDSLKASVQVCSPARSKTIKARQHCLRRRHSTSHQNNKEQSPAPSDEENEDPDFAGLRERATTEYDIKVPRTTKMGVLPVTTDDLPKQAVRMTTFSNQGMGDCLLLDNTIFYHEVENSEGENEKTKNEENYVSSLVSYYERLSVSKQEKGDSVLPLHSTQRHRSARERAIDILKSPLEIRRAARSRRPQKKSPGYRHQSIIQNDHFFSLDEK